MSILATIAFLFMLSAAEPAALPAGPAPATASLDLQVDLPAQLASEAVTVELRQLPGKQRVERRELASGDGLHRFEQIPPGPLEVELDTSLGPFPKIIELEAGQDGFLVMAPELLRVWGTVYQDDEGVPARLAFTTVKRTQVEVQSDEYGEYEIASLDPLRSASVRLGWGESEETSDENGGDEDDADAEPRREPVDYNQVFWEKVDSPRQIDFHLPDVRIAAQVVDAETGQGIGDATVIWMNSFLPEGETDPSKNEKSHVSMESDEDGFAEPPLARPGSVTLQALAEGYLPGDEMVIPVSEGEPNRTVQLALEPAGEPVELRVTLPTGEPAVGARALVFPSLASRRPLAHGEAGADGALTLPRPPSDAVLIVRHPAAAVAIRPWPAASSFGPVAGGGAVSLPLAAAAPPLTVRVMDPSGVAPARRVPVAVWVQGHRLTGSLLAMAMGGRPFTDLQGFLVLEGLPRGPVEVLAWEQGVAAEGAAGALDGLAREIPYPWPSEVEIQVVR